MQPRTGNPLLAYMYYETGNPLSVLFWELSSSMCTIEPGTRFSKELGTLY